MKIDQKALEEFRKTLPIDIQDEVFSWLRTTYSVVAALFIIQKEGIDLSTINVELWCKALGMSGPRKPDTELAFSLFNGVCDKDAMQPKINPDIPVILVEHSYKVGKKTETTPLIIDGNKRLRKACIEGRETLRAYYLPKNLAKLCIV